MKKLVRNKADVVGLILLVVIALGGAALALAGREEGLYIFLLMGGVGLGWALVHLALRRWGARKKRVALLAMVGVVALMLAPLVGLFLDVGWLVYPSLASGSPLGLLLRSRRGRRAGGVRRAHVVRSPGGRLSRPTPRGKRPVGAPAVVAPRTRTPPTA